MQYLVDMAWRNIGRNRRRSLMAVISVTIAILCIVMMQGMVGGILDSLVRNYTRNETGHIRIATQSFEDRTRFMPIDTYLQDPGALVTKLKADPILAPQLDAIAPRIRFGVLLSHDGNNKSAFGMAGDPSVEKDLLLLDRSIQSGGHALQGPRELVMGSKLAADLKYKVGDTVSVMARGSDYALHLRKFTLVGVFASGIAALDNKVFMVGLEDAQQLLRMGSGVQQLIIMLKDHHQSDAVAERIQSILGASDGTPGALLATPWTKIGDTYSLVTFAGSLYNMIFMIIALLGAIIIANIMMMVVMERRKEIGILRAMGLKRREVLALFLLEGSFLGLIGSLTGATVGMLFNLYLHNKGIDFSTMNMGGSMPLDNIIYFAISPGMWLRSVVLGTVIASLIALLPSRRASQLRIVEAIKSV